MTREIHTHPLSLSMDLSTLPGSARGRGDVGCESACEVSCEESCESTSQTITAHPLYVNIGEICYCKFCDYHLRHETLHHSMMVSHNRMYHKEEYDLLERGGYIDSQGI